MPVIPPQIWVIIPAYNEEKYLAKVLTNLQAYTKNIILVDDGSQDSTVEIAEKYAQYVLVHRLNLGKGAALKTGCEFAFDHLGAKAVIVMDADDQHDPAELQLFVNALAAGHQLVLGVRSFNQKMPVTRRIGNQLASQLVRGLFGSYIPDIPSGYKAFTKQAYQKIRWQATDYTVELEIAVKIARYRLPFTTVAIQTIYHDTEKGMTMLDTLAMLKQILVYKIQL